MKTLEFLVTKQELVSEVYYPSPVLSILKRKGAPINGTFWLELEPGWEVLFEEDVETQTALFTFVKES